MKNNESNMQRDNFFITLLLVLFSGFCHAQTDRDPIMQMLLKESQEEAQSILGKNTDLRSLEVEAKDGILIYHYLCKEGKYKQPQSQEDIDLMKESIITSLKASFNFPQEENEGFTEEEIFEHLKGFRFVYLEENTRKGFQIDISSEEIRNAKSVVTSMDEQTQEKVMAQMTASRFANDIAKYNKEGCPMVSGVIVIDSITYDYQNLYYHCHVNSTKQLVGDGEINALKNGLQNQMVFAGQVSDIFTTLAKLDNGWYMNFLVLDIDSLISVYFTPEEVKKMVEGDSSLNSVERARYSLNDVIENTNKQLPTLLDILTRWDTIYVDGENLVYQYTILNEFEQLKEKRDALEWILRSQMMSSTDTQTQYLILLCSRAGYGICHRYIPLDQSTNVKKKAKKPKKSDIINVCFSAEELEEMVR